MAADLDWQLFTAQEITSPEEVVQYVTRKVSDEMNSFLSAPFTTVEVEKAIFAMKPNKSPGSDGFTTGFYQQH
jgi:hypothetical protein